MAIGEELWDKGEAAARSAFSEIDTLDAPNRFLREQYIAAFNRGFTVLAAERGTAFRRSRTDLEWIFTIQTERVVAKDSTLP